MEWLHAKVLVQRRFFNIQVIVREAPIPTCSIGTRGAYVVAATKAAGVNPGSLLQHTCRAHIDDQPAKHARVLLIRQNTTTVKRVNPVFCLTSNLLNQ